MFISLLLYFDIANIGAIKLISKFFLDYFLVFTKFFLFLLYLSRNNE